MASSIADFLIEIGFSGDAIKGLKAVEKQLDSLEKRKDKARKKEKDDKVIERDKLKVAKQKEQQQKREIANSKKLEIAKQRESAAAERLNQFRQIASLNVTGSKNFQRLSPAQQNIARTELKNVKNTRDVQLLRAKINRDAQAYTNTLKKQNYLLRRQVESAKQLSGNMVSAFAVVGAGVGLTQVGMDFESINAGMLAASSSSKDAGNNLRFVQDESVRLGLSLKETAKSYTKLLASNQGQLSQQDVEGLFTGVSEASTVLGLSQDDQVGTIRAYCIGSLY